MTLPHPTSPVPVFFLWLWLNPHCSYPHRYLGFFPESFHVHPNFRIMGCFRLISLVQMISELATYLLIIYSAYELVLHFTSPSLYEPRDVQSGKLEDLEIWTCQYLRMSSNRLNLGWTSQLISGYRGATYFTHTGQVVPTEEVPQHTDYPHLQASLPWVMGHFLQFGSKVATWLLAGRVGVEGCERNGAQNPGGQWQAVGSCRPNRPHRLAVGKRAVCSQVVWSPGEVRTYKSLFNYFLSGPMEKKTHGYRTKDTLLPIQLPLVPKGEDDQNHMPLHYLLELWPPKRLPPQKARP